jgi:hypothetical protein
MLKTISSSVGVLGHTWQCCFIQPSIKAGPQLGCCVAWQETCLPPLHWLLLLLDPICCCFLLILALLGASLTCGPIEAFPADGDRLIT